MNDAAEGWEEGHAERAEALLGHRFADRGLLELAFTHPSWSYEHDGTRGNERLEYLGDAVIDLVVAHLLFDAQPGWPEGDLTRGRRALVNNRNLAAYARDLGLGELVRLGRGERRAGGAERERLLGNLFEAVVGALYLDGGLEVATRFLRGRFGDAVGARAELPEVDPKTRLQEWSVAEHRVFPSYATVGDSGVENDEGRFRVEVHVGDERFGTGEGRTKREAEREAAMDGLRRAGIES
ncbi:MAG TPA: ribonuclease III [Myxococcota bacterium]|nr:ribonuclease III [Myxococcota bacterium]